MRGTGCEMRARALLLPGPTRARTPTASTDSGSGDPGAILFADFGHGEPLLRSLRIPSAPAASGLDQSLRAQGLILDAHGPLNRGLRAFLEVKLGNGAKRRIVDSGNLWQTVNPFLGCGGVTAEPPLHGLGDGVNLFSVEVLPGEWG